MAAQGEVFSLLLQVMLVLTVAKICSVTLYRLGQPEILGEIIAGIILGPTFLNLLRPNIVFEFLAEFGILLFLFGIGLETELRALREIGGKVGIIALGDVLIPSAIGLMLGYALKLGGIASLYLASLFAVTSIGVSMRVLSDLGMMGTQESRAVLGTAICDDVAGMILLAILLGLAETGSLSLLSILKVMLGSIAFISISLFLGSRVFPRLMEPIAKIPMRGVLLVFALFLGISTAYLASLLGLAPILGAFIAGVLLAESREKEIIIDDLTPLSHILTPIFFVLMGVRVDVKSILYIVSPALLLTLLAIGGKIVGCGSTSLLAGFNRRAALIIGLSMIPKGEVGLIFAKRGADVGLIGEHLYAVSVLMVLGTTLTAPLLLRLLLRRGEHQLYPSEES